MTNLMNELRWLLYLAEIEGAYVNGSMKPGDNPDHDAEVRDAMRPGLAPRPPPSGIVKSARFAGPSTQSTSFTGFFTRFSLKPRNNLLFW
jgi:hypothetical protein